MSDVNENQMLEAYNMHIFILIRHESLVVCKDGI